MGIRIGFFSLLFVLSTACQPAQVVTPAVAPTMPSPPETRAIPTAAPVTLVPPPTRTPVPTLAATPTAVQVALEQWRVYEGQATPFTFRFPPDWAGREYTQAITRTVYPLAVDIVWLRGPGGPAAPEFVLMHNWPALDPTQPPANATAWSSVAGLAKLFLYPSCVTTFNAPAPLTLAGQQTMGAKFVVQCDRLYAGYLVGLVSKGKHYGMLVDVPAEDWDAWRSTFEAIFASFTLSP